MQGNEKLRSLHKKIDTMFAEVRQSLQLILESLCSGEHQSAKVRELNKNIDELELRIDQHCISLLVSERLYGTDLRYVFTSGKTVKDLERIGDECGNVMRFMRQCEASENCNRESEKQNPQNKKDKQNKQDHFKEMVPLCRLSLQMFDLAEEAFVKDEFLGMKELLLLEEQVDAKEAEIIQKSSDTHIVLIARSLERVGDLSTNLAENMIYNLKGKDIRHGHFESLELK